MDSKTKMTESRYIKTGLNYLVSKLKSMLLPQQEGPLPFFMKNWDLALKKPDQVCLARNVSTITR